MQTHDQQVAEQRAAEQKAAYEQQLQQMKLQTALLQSRNRGGSGTGSTILDSWLSQQTGGGTQQQQQQYDPNETIDSLLGGNNNQQYGPSNPNQQQAQPSFWQKFSQPRTLQQQKQVIGNIKIPKVLQGIFGTRLGRG